MAVAGLARVHWLAAPHSGQRCGSTGVSVMPGLQLHLLHPGFQALAEGQFKQAETLMRKSAPDSEQALLNYLSAAEAAEAERIAAQERAAQEAKATAAREAAEASDKARREAEAKRLADERAAFEAELAAFRATMQAEADRRAAEALMESVKDHDEHRHVVDAIVEALAPLCELSADALTSIERSKPVKRHFFNMNIYFS